MTSLSDPLTDHWASNAVATLGPYLAGARRSVDIASGYFTVQGYDLIRQHMGAVRVRLLIGFDESSGEELRQAVIDNLLAHLASWKAEDRRAAVIDLVRRLEQRKFLISKSEVDSLEGRTRRRDHAKVYIFDERRVLAGSANLTAGGLKRNVENLTPVDEPGRVEYYVSQFRMHWEAESTQDLTEELLEALRRWLALAPPFHIYLKTLHLLLREERQLNLREEYKYPVDYQLAVIERVLRQLEKYRGGMLVASTGLGKTVMATHAAVRLEYNERITNVIIFSPKQVHPDWRYSMRMAGLSAEIFTRNLLDANRMGQALRAVEEALAHVNSKYLIIIDESQHFRNRMKADASAKRNSFKRLGPLVKEKKPLVLLLTATPYSKGVSDLNNQLELLPHTAPRSNFDSKGQGVLEGMMDDYLQPEAWKVREKDDFFEDFIQLPVATVISTSQVAKDYATTVEEGSYIDFGDERRWLPAVFVHRVTTPLALEKEVTELIHSGLLGHAKITFCDRKRKWHHTKTKVRNQIETSWSSSPLTLLNSLRNVIDPKELLEGEKMKVNYHASLEERTAKIAPLIDELESLPPAGDPKYVSLLTLLREELHGKKVLVFCDYLPTALYLEQALQEDLSYLVIASTVQEVKGKVEQRKFEPDTLDMIKRFAPISNADKITRRSRKKEIDILITTNALSTGVNLQDASVVINYDMPWTPDVLIQRAGRILRMWREPRAVAFYTFVYDFGPADEKLHDISRRIRERMERLRKRTELAQQFSELPLLSNEASVQYKNLGDLSRIKIEHLGEASLEELEEFTGVSPFLNHSRALLAHQQLAQQLPNDLTSARHYSGNAPLVYLLLRSREDKLVYLLFNERTKRFSDPAEDGLFSLLECSPDAQTAAISADETEARIQAVFRQWLHRERIEDELAYQRVCGCLLLPEGSAGTGGRALLGVGGGAV